MPKHERVLVQFAAVLNEKKAKAVEWKLKAEQAQASVQKASTEVSIKGWCSCYPVGWSSLVAPACSIFASLLALACRS